MCSSQAAGQVSKDLDPRLIRGGHAVIPEYHPHLVPARRRTPRGSRFPEFLASLLIDGLAGATLAARLAPARAKGQPWEAPGRCGPGRRRGRTGGWRHCRQRCGGSPNALWNDRAPRRGAADTAGGSGQGTGRRLGATDRAWSSEADGDRLLRAVPLAVAAVAEPTLRRGTAIAPADTRGPACLAQSAATLAATAPGRFALGVGSSSERDRGADGTACRSSAPCQRARDTVRFLRASDWPVRTGRLRSYETFTGPGLPAGS